MLVENTQYCHTPVCRTGPLAARSEETLKQARMHSFDRPKIILR